MQIKIKKLRPDAILPARITPGSAAYDAIIPEDVRLRRGRQIIPLGYAISMPPTLALDCRTRAGYAAKGMLVYRENGNEARIDADVTLGLIDSDYRNEVGAIIHVHDHRLEGTRFYLHRGQALAQLKFCLVPETEFVEVDELDTTGRTGGFGEMNGE